MSWTDEQTDDVKTVYPPTNTVCGGGIINTFQYINFDNSEGSQLQNCEHWQGQ